MALLRLRRTLQDTAGNAITGASVTITKASNGLAAALYTDALGVNQISGNVLLTDSVGSYAAYLAAGTYNFSFSKNGQEIAADFDVTLGYNPADLPRSVADTGGVAGADAAAALSSAATLSDRVLFPDGAWPIAAAPSITTPLFIHINPAATFSGAGAASMGLSTTKGHQLLQRNTSATDIATQFIRRIANHTGGTAGYVSAAQRVESDVPDGATNFEWTHLTVLRNYASAGENVSQYAQANKYGTGPTWARVSEAIDWTDTANPTSGLVAHEIDIRANRTDNNNNRLGIDIVASRPMVGGIHVGEVMAAGFGIRLQHGGDSGAQFTVGFDTSVAVVGQASYKMAQNQVIAFNSDATRQLCHNGTSWVFKNNSGTTYWSLNDDASLVVQGTQILGSRNTGWSTATGTLTSAKGAFDADTATLVDTARHVAAIRNALMGHGLLGA